MDRLLESPHHGERWGRWWLDQARYADSHGYSVDGPRSIWKYRDWVIAAINADMPFDRFTVEQLAGDLLPAATDDQRIATGFHRNTQINQEGGIDPEQFRVEAVFDRVATTATVWLGLTIGCAQCHDHKFDPVEQREYYELFAFFNDQDEVDLEVVDDRVDPAKLSAARNAAKEALAAYMQSRAAALVAWEAGLSAATRLRLDEKVALILDQPVAARSFNGRRRLMAVASRVVDDEFLRLEDEYERAAEAAKGITTMVLAERKRPRTTTRFEMGDFTSPADEVAPGTPAILPPLHHAGERPNRLDLARWLVDPTHPLTARVIVNRVWQQYFGVGLVETENDFGLIGTPPSLPDLLDWLACEFVSNGWSLKRLHRLIVTSETYKQSSVRRPDLDEIDPLNRLLARQKRLRIDAEGVRDAALAASGLLVPTIGGPPVVSPIPAGVTDQGQVKHAWRVSTGADRYRRALYAFRFRATPVPALAVFDAPDGYVTCTRRSRSNTPLQALTLLNDQAFFEFAGGLEKVIRAEGVETAFVRCTSRRPTAAELAVLAQLDPFSQARVLLNLEGDHHPGVTSCTAPPATIEERLALTRRHFLASCPIGVGAVGLATLLGREAAAVGPAPTDPLAPRPPHFPPRAKSVIFLFMAGGPSQLDLFEHKPDLDRLDAEPIPESFIAGKRFAFMDRMARPKLLATKYRFARHGGCGVWVSELLPHTARIVDDLTIVSFCKTDLFNHAPAKLFMNTRTRLFGRPSIGAWGDLWPGKRVRRPARLRRDAQRPAGPPGRQRELGLRHAAQCLPGRSAPQCR